MLLFLLYLNYYVEGYNQNYISILFVYIIHLSRGSIIHNNIYILFLLKIKFKFNIKKL